MLRKLKRSPSGRLALHTLDLSVIFVIIAVPAFLLSMLVKFGARAGASLFLVHTLTLLEHAILVVDSTLVLFLLIRGAWIFLRETGR